MEIMKRARGDEVQFGARPGAAGVSSGVGAGNPGGPGGGQAPPTHHRIIGAQQHGGGGPTIQYQLASGGILKSADSTTVQPQTVQYSTSYNVTPITSGHKSNQSISVTGPVSDIQQQVGGQQQQQQPTQQIHVTSSTINSVNAMRHKNVPPPPPNVTPIINAQINSLSQQQPQQQPPPPQQQQQQQQQQQPAPANMGAQPPPRLKVEDALSYLDQVKFQYADQPQIYNNFLDIMKEFKSQCIDTPGVIQRVSNLFKGHTELIYGFNMFLPPGYKIEIQSNDQGISVPVVSMPGTSTVLPSSAGPVSLIAQTSPASHKAITSTTGTNVVHQIQPLTSGAVNLITHSSGAPPQPVSGNSLPPTAIHSALPPPPQQQVQQTPLGTTNQIMSIVPPQNFSREQQHLRERTSSMSTGNIISGSLTPVNDMNNQGGHNLHQISQAHHSILLAETGVVSQQNQPVEFNHAITYVNKIKNRFQNQPEKYKRFLDILHTYQKEQKVLKEGANIQQPKTLTEAEVYTQVAKLFDQQEDLLREFGQFLPDATNHSASHYMTKAHNDHKKNIMTSTIAATTLTTSNIVGAPTISHGPMAGPIKGYSQNNLSRLERDPYDHHTMMRDKERPLNNKFSAQTKKSPSYSGVAVGHIPRNRGASDDLVGGPPAKRLKPICRDVTFAEASRYGTLSDAAFFDKVRKSLRSPEVYEDFLRCLMLFNQEIISKTELQCLVSPFLSKFPELHRWFQDFLGPATVPEGISLNIAQRQDRNQGSSELAQEIDLASCKRLGASYCALPKTTEPKKCSGRTPLCREVLNDTWVSFPTWASEDSTFVTSRKTQFEEIIYRTEDERFELDVVIETNSSTIRVLEGVQKKLSRMSQDELQRYRLDDCLGGTSPTVHQRAIKRIYGEKGEEIIQGLKKNPMVAVPVVLRRLKAKEEEWREAQKNFNKQWREQNEKYYLKSLDHQAINFKPNDIKALRSKSLFNEIETLYDERHEQNEESAEPVTGPHLTLHYKDKTILDDAANLLIHHVKRQSGIQKSEKVKIKHIIRQFIPDLFFSNRQPLSDDEKDDDDKENTSNADAEENGSGDSNNKITTISSTKLSSGTSSNNYKNSAIKTEEGKIDANSDTVNSKSSTIITTPFVTGGCTTTILNKQENNSTISTTSTMIIAATPIPSSNNNNNNNNKSILLNTPSTSANYILNYPNNSTTINLLAHSESSSTTTNNINKILHSESAISIDSSSIALEATKTSILSSINNSNIKNEISKTSKINCSDETNKIKNDHPHNNKNIIDSSNTVNINNETTVNLNSNNEGSNNLNDNNSSNNSIFNNNNNNSNVSNNNSNILNSNTSNDSAVTDNNNKLINNDATKNSNNNSDGKNNINNNDNKIDINNSNNNNNNNDKNISKNNNNKENNSNNSSGNYNSEKKNDNESNKNDVDELNHSESKIEIKIENDSGDSTMTNVLPPHAISKNTDEAYSLFFANNNWYLFLRLHAILCERLRIMYERAQILAIEEEKHRLNRRESTAAALRLKPKSDIQVEDYYPSFLDMLKNVLDGNVDTNSYEDSLREMFGIHAYISFTLDRVVSNAVRQLQHCVTEKGALECVELFQIEQRKNGAGGPCKTANKRLAAEISYQRKAESSLQDENCFKVYIYKIDCRVTIELLDTENEETEKTITNAQSWNKYVERLVNPATTNTSQINNTSLTNTGNNSANAVANNAVNRSTTNNDKNDSIINVEIKIEKPDEDMNLMVLSRKPICLQRNIRKAHLKHPSIKLNSSNITNKTKSDTQSTNAISSTSASSDQTMKVFSNESSTTCITSPSVSNNTVSTSSKNSNSDCSVVNSAGVNLMDEYWNKRPPERIGKVSGVNENYVISDREEVKIAPSSYKMIFVSNKDVCLYKKNSMKKAKQTHEAVTRAMSKRFHLFISKWLQKNVNEIQKHQCSEWLMGRSNDLAPNDTKIFQGNDISKTPYKKYNRYRVERRSES